MRVGGTDRNLSCHRWAASWFHSVRRNRKALGHSGMPPAASFAGGSCVRACVIAYFQHRPACFYSGENSSELWIVIVSVLQGKKKIAELSDIPVTESWSLRCLINHNNKYANIPHAFKRPFASNGGMPTQFETNLMTTKDSGLSTLSCSVPRAWR